MNVERVALVAALLLVAGCVALTLCLVLARLIKDCLLYTSDAADEL